MEQSYCVPASGRKACESDSGLELLQNDNNVGGSLIIPDSWPGGKLQAGIQCWPLSERQVPRRGWLASSFFYLVHLGRRLASGPGARSPPPPYDKRHREAGRGIPTGMRGRVVCKEWLNGGCHTRLKACRCQCQHHAILLPTEILRKVLLKLLWG